MVESSELSKPEAGTRLLSLLSEAGRRAIANPDLGQTLRETGQIVSSALCVEYCGVLELRPDGKAIVLAGVGWKEGVVGQTTLEMKSGSPAGQVILTQIPVIIDDLRIDQRFPEAPLLRGHGVVSSLNVPIYGRMRPLGVLGAHTSRLRKFTEEDVHFLQAVANMLSAVIEHQSHQEQQREQKLLRAEQMMAVGQVAAGVAHELRNPLTSIKGLVQVNLREATKRGLPADDFAVIEHEIRRMERTLQTFLDFARPPQPDRRRLDLATVIERVSTVASGRARKQQVSLQVIQPDDPVVAEADQDQLQQLLLNLVLNSLDALPQGGAVEIELRPARDNFVELHVRDSGPGIAPHILPKVFETFVSTKETGVGLGLPLSRRIAEEHGGTLSGYNLPEGGACFVLRLPSSALA